MHAIMKHWHPMIGRDFHIPWPPGSPSPAPSPAPYLTGQTLMGLAIKASYASSHMSMGWGMTMQQGTDIGYMIPHVGPPSALLAIEIPLSSSVSYFGTSMVMVENKPACVALAMLVNYNLNCGTPVPTPTGIVIAANTHFAAMTLGDLLGGVAVMAMDVAIGVVLGKAIGAGSGWAAGRLGPRVAQWLGPRAYNRTLFQTAMRHADSRAIGMNVAEFEADMARELIEEQAPEIVKTALSTVAGESAKPVVDAVRKSPGEPGTKATREAYREMGDYLESGDVEEHPSPGTDPILGGWGSHTHG